VQFGVVYPQTEFGNDPNAIRDYAQAVEGMGFSHILAYSHILGANPERPGGWSGPYTHKSAFQEPLLLFSYMAGFTEKLEFATGIIILPQRQTALFAKQAATLDLLCGGRLRLGIGIGWNEIEYTALNQNFNDRGRRVEEQIELLKLLWTQPLVQYEGHWHNIPDAGLNPLPVQRPIPIWFGGSHDRVLRRIALMGDGWMPNYGTPEEAKSSLERLDSYLRDAGRPRSDLGLEARLKYGNGDPSSWIRLIADWDAAGATHVSINTMGQAFKSPADHIRAVETFARAISL